ncbi:CENP-S associating centromere protein X-domain-containing protein [Annulohypoxylon stygium]|nr:CENP-S associating centromere protein X-domain-containing protein [Annulohypoxylon stygium]
MPPKQSSTSTRGRGASSASSRPTKTSKGQSSTARAGGQSARSPQVIGSDDDPFAEDERVSGGRGRADDTMDVDEGGEESEEEERKTIPPELLTHILHEFFEKDGTRVSKDANAAIAKYMDIFVREAIARTVVEKEKGFLEIEDLEKVAPQLLLDL